MKGASETSLSSVVVVSCCRLLCSIVVESGMSSGREIRQHSVVIVVGRHRRSTSSVVGAGSASRQHSVVVVGRCCGMSAGLASCSHSVFVIGRGWQVGSTQSLVVVVLVVDSGMSAGSASRQHSVVIVVGCQSRVGKLAALSRRSSSSS